MVCVLACIMLATILRICRTSAHVHTSRLRIHWPTEDLKRSNSQPGFFDDATSLSQDDQDQENQNPDAEHVVGVSEGQSGGWSSMTNNWRQLDAHPAWPSKCIISSRTRRPSHPSISAWSTSTSSSVITPRTTPRLSMNPLTATRSIRFVVA